MCCPGVENVHQRRDKQHHQNYCDNASKPPVLQSDPLRLKLMLPLSNTEKEKFCLIQYNSTFRQDCAIGSLHSLMGSSRSFKRA